MFHQSPTRPNFGRSRVKVCPILCRLRTTLCPNFGCSRARLCPIYFAPCPFPNLAGTLQAHCNISSVERRGGVVSESDTRPTRVVTSSACRSVTRACVPGQNTLPLIACVFSDKTLKILGPFYQGAVLLTR